MMNAAKETQITAIFLAILFLLPVPSTLSAQSILAGELGGRVVDEAGYPIRGAAVTLAKTGGEIGPETETEDDGSFSFAYVPEGTYDLRVEALGYRPRLVVEVRVTPGDRVQVPVLLVAEPPPVTRRDTVLWVASGRTAPTQARSVGGGELSDLPDRVRDATALLVTSSWADRWGGLEGLPASFTTLSSGGEFFRPATHPGLPTTGAPYGLLFPRLGLASATVSTGLEDIEWGGTTGALLSLEPKGPAGQVSGQGFGLWSGGGMWSGDAVKEGPSITSAWGGGTASFPLAQGQFPASLTFEAGILETPNVLWRNESGFEDLGAEPSGPGTRTSRYGAGSVRADFRAGRDGFGTVRGGFSTFKNQSDRQGVPEYGYGVELPGTGTDGTLAVVFANPVGRFTFLEIKSSVGFSTRSWETETGALPGAYLVADQALLGTNPSYPATSDRLELSFSPVIHYRWGESLLKGGVRLNYGSFDMRYVDESAGAFFFGDGQALSAGEGSAIVVPGEVPSESFGILSTRLFGQYRWQPVPGMDITTGLAWRHERTPMGDIMPSVHWADVTGLDNVSRQRKFNDFDGRIHLRWDATGDGRNWILGGMGVDHGGFDIAAMHEVLTLDGPVSVDRAIGGGLDWEGDAVPPDLAIRGTRLAMFAPDLRLPLTTRAALGLYRNLPKGVRVGVSGSLRRTESILRRTDLNRLLIPVGTDQNGRPLYGDLQIVSGILVADPGTNRRLPEFESVWALRDDGWSRYKAITASLEASIGEGGSVSLDYTYSQTRDNWVGAGKAGALAQLDPALPVKDWDESVSDFDVPHRLTAMVVVPLPLLSHSYLSGLYTFRSSEPFTARVATGLDANGDGSPFNDVAFVPSEGPEIGTLAARWDCVASAMGDFAERNACRPDPLHTLDLRLSLRLPDFRGVSGVVVLDGLNLTDTEMGVRNDNLLVIGGDSVVRDGDRVNIPYRVNPDFGDWVFRGDTGRMFRIGLRIGGGR